MSYSTMAQSFHLEVQQQLVSLLAGLDTVSTALLQRLLQLCPSFDQLGTACLPSVAATIADFPSD